MPDRWEITQLEPDIEPFDLANNLAVHFSKITNIAAPLDLSKIPKSTVGSGLIPQLDCINVKRRLKIIKSLTVV